MTEELDLAVERARKDHLPPALQPYDPAQDHEQIRSRIAYLMIALLIAIVAAMFGGLFAGLIPVETAEKLAGVVLSPVIGLLGAVLGFYYGERSRQP